MSMEDDLRLAWQANRVGKHGRRDALLTLAAVQAPADTPWLPTCRARLIETHPDHIFARFTTLSEALEHPRVDYALEKLRALYHPGKVANLVRRDEVRRGPWTGQRPPLSRILNDLFDRRSPTLSRSVPLRAEPPQTRSRHPRRPKPTGAAIAS